MQRVSVNGTEAAYRLVRATVLCWRLHDQGRIIVAVDTLADPERL